MLFQKQLACAEFMQRLSRHVKSDSFKRMFLTWTALLVVSMYIGLTVIFLIVSAFALMYYNTRTDSFKTGKSAYSVFNPNMERITGDRDPDSLDRQLRSGVVW